MLVSSFGNVASSFRRTSAKLRLDEILMCSTESVCDVRLACVAAWIILCSPKRFMRWRSSESKVSHSGREVRPGRLEGVYAFRPRAHQDRVGTVLAAFGVADRQSVNRDSLRVNQCAHGHSFRERTVGRVVSSWFTIPPYRPLESLGVLSSI